MKHDPYDPYNFEDPTDRIVKDIMNGIDDGPSHRVQPEEPVAPEDLHDLITSSAATMLKAGLAAVANLKAATQAAPDPDTIEAYASVMKSTSAALEILSKMQMQNDKIKAQEQLEDKRHKNRLEQDQARLLGDGDNNKGGNTTNVFIATREELLKGFLDGSTSERPVQGVVIQDVVAPSEYSADIAIREGV